MLRSMFAGVSGLRNHQIKMDVIGNNIANVNTQGYKTSRTTFAEMFNQTLAGATRPSQALGGLNPKQVGLGVSTSSIDVVFTTGGMMTTDRMLDLAIQGDGFISVLNGDDIFYTRAGNLYLDENGFLVAANGMMIMGVNLLDHEYFDSAFEAIDVDGGRTIEELGVKDPQELGDLFDPEFGGRIDPDNYEEALGPLAIPLNFVSISIDKTGLVTGIDAEGELRDIAVIPLACFVNAPGLTREGDNLYRVSSNSGIPGYYQPGQGGVAGEVRAGALEMSNVDLSKEFTDMIITQRGFQANSRIITVSDTLLEELINLKR
ncbi:MAG: flagellar hook-basal body complex protein [Oscillospiraceae bacterium]|nr:flagellar hook-basal body complex protein [Oscillospiraceae bacterium]